MTQSRGGSWGRVQGVRTPPPRFVYTYSLVNSFTSPSVTSFLRGAPLLLRKILVPPCKGGSLKDLHRSCNREWIENDERKENRTKTLGLSDSTNISAREKTGPDSNRNKQHKTPIRLIKSLFLFKLRFHKPGQFSWLK